MNDVLVRRSPRQAIRRALKVSCEVVRERDAAFVGELALDLSQDGMRVVSEADVEPGELLVVSFRATLFNLRFRTSANVARVLSGRRNGDRERSIGLEFASLDAVSRLILRGNLRKVPPPIPRRPQPKGHARTVTLPGP